MRSPVGCSLLVVACTAVIVLLAACDVAVLAASPPPTPVTSYDAIDGSGDKYPTDVPRASLVSAFAGKKVLFALSHGAEDHEVYYQHSYFVARGATVEFGCPSTTKPDSGVAVISDFYKPTYVVKCKSLSVIDLNHYDAVFVVGGMPSSSALRVSDFPKKMYQFWSNPDNKRKILALICSGTETLIEAGMLPEMDLAKNGGVVGSPASAWSFHAALTAAKLDPALFKGNDDSVSVITYPSDEHHAKLVVGKNPMASPAFVLAIGKAWMGLAEVTGGQTVPLTFDANGVYNHPQFTPIRTMKQIPNVRNPVISLPKSSVNYAGKSVGIAVASGSTDIETNALYNYYKRAGADVTFVCPGWIPQYKSGKVYLLTDPPVKPTFQLKCDTSFAGHMSLNVLIVPGGLFATNGVLRNDGDLQSYLKSLYGTANVLAFLDSGVQALLPTDNGISRKNGFIAADKFAERDITNAGFTLARAVAIRPAVIPGLQGNRAAIVTGTSGKKFGGLRPFVAAIDKAVLNAPHGGTARAPKTSVLKKKLNQKPLF